MWIINRGRPLHTAPRPKPSDTLQSGKINQLAKYSRSQSHLGQMKNYCWGNYIFPPSFLANDTAHPPCAHLATTKVASLLCHLLENGWLLASRWAAAGSPAPWAGYTVGAVSPRPPGYPSDARKPLTLTVFLPHNQHPNSNAAAYFCVKHLTFTFPT